MGQGSEDADVEPARNLAREPDNITEVGDSANSACTASGSPLEVMRPPKHGGSHPGKICGSIFANMKYANAYTLPWF